jgi:Holliday junction resolvase RusA-like endonuclease
LTETLVLDVFGTPTPKGSMRAILVNGRATLVPGGTNAQRDALKRWTKAIVTACEGAVAARSVATGEPMTPIDEPVSVSVRFLLAQTKDQYRTRHATKPDLDKLLRGVFDAIVGQLITDDARICAVDATKRYAVGRPTGARIEVTLLGESEARDRETRRARAREARARG